MRFKYYLRGAGIGVIVATLILSITFLLQDGISDEEVIRRAIKLGMVMEENSPGTLADMQQPDATAVDLENKPDGTSGQDGQQPGVQDAGKQDTSAKDDSDKESGKKEEGAKDSSKDSQEKEDADTQSGTDSKQDSSKDKASGSGNKEDGNTDKPSGSGSKEDGNTDKPSGSGSKEDGNTDKPSGSGGQEGGSGSKPSNAGSQSGDVEITIEAGDVSRKVSAKVFEAGLVESADEFNSYLGAHGYDNMLQPGTYKIAKGSSFRQIARILTTR